MVPKDEEIENLRETVALLRDMVKELKETDIRREKEVKRALEAKFNKAIEQEREEINILLIVLVVALTVEIALFLIIMFKM